MAQRLCDSCEAVFVVGDSPQHCAACGCVQDTPANEDVVQTIVTKIWSDLTGRSGIDNALEGCDEDIQAEIKESMAQIVRNYGPSTCPTCNWA